MSTENWAEMYLSTGHQTALVKWERGNFYRYNNRQAPQINGIVVRIPKANGDLCTKCYLTKETLEEMLATLSE